MILKKKRNYQLILYSSLWKTQIRSQSYATIFSNMIRLKKCLRCVGEVAQFLNLIYSIDPKSTAFKCINYIKKSKSYKNISLKLSSLANPLLTSGEIPVKFHCLLYKLKFAVAYFTKGHASQKDIDIA